MLFVAPFRILGLKQSVRALAESRLACRDPFSSTPRLDWIDASRDKLAGFGRFLTGLGERDGRVAQSHFSHPAAKGEAEDPFPGAGSGHDKIEPSPVAIAAQASWLPPPEPKVFLSPPSPPQVLQLVLQFDADYSGQAWTSKDDIGSKYLIL
jgi:hypothetical protein